MSAGSKVIVFQMSALKKKSLKWASGTNERRGTEDFEINKRRGAHSGKYGSLLNIVSHHCQWELNPRP